MNLNAIFEEIWPKLELYLKKLLATIQELFSGSTEA